MGIATQRKEGRRSKQLAAEAARDRAEDEYFQRCQAEAIKSCEVQRIAAGLSGLAADAHEKALFAQQGSQGIQFDKYSEIKVETSGPGADSAPPLIDFTSVRALPAFLTRNIQLMGYVTPTPIQKHAVPLGLAGCDLMCCAQVQSTRVFHASSPHLRSGSMFGGVQTGSGKTAAFLIPVCASLSAASAGATTVGTAGAAKPRAVVMAPTRELASQIELEAQKLANRSALRPVVVYGGADQRAQAKALALGADIIVATPGRLNDFVERGIVDLRRVVFLVLDEADRMLDMGFEPQIRRIVQVGTLSTLEYPVSTLRVPCEYP
jgi:ATP-dependent RNA helicase DDX3X